MSKPLTILLLIAFVAQPVLYAQAGHCEGCEAGTMATAAHVAGLNAAEPDGCCGQSEPMPAKQPSESPSDDGPCSCPPTWCTQMNLQSLFPVGHMVAITTLTDQGLVLSGDLLAQPGPPLSLLVPPPQHHAFV